VKQNALLACLHGQNKVAFLEGRLLFSQSEQSEKFQKVLIGWKKPALQKKPLLL